MVGKRLEAVQSALSGHPRRYEAADLHPISNLELFSDNFCRLLSPSQRTTNDFLRVEVISRTKSAYSPGLLATSFGQLAFAVRGRFFLSFGMTQQIEIHGVETG